MGKMIKTPEEIKKDLAAWGTGVRIDIGCGEFVPPTPEYMLNGVRTADVCRDALAYIQRLEQQNAELVRKTEQLERERDALENDLYSVVNDYVTPCFCCKIFEPSTTVCDHEGVDCFIWRGVQELPEGV